MRSERDGEVIGSVHVPSEDEETEMNMLTDMIKEHGKTRQKFVGSKDTTINFRMGRIWIDKTICQRSGWSPLIKEIDTR